MQELGLTPLMCGARESVEPFSDGAWICIDGVAARNSTIGLYVTQQGGLQVGLSAAPAGAGGEQPKPPALEDAELVAELRCCDEDGTPAWYLVVRSHRLQINGRRPYPLTRLEPGVLLSIDRCFWLVSYVWQPQPCSVPDELADRSCPVCGGRLSAAPAVQCPGPDCGRWTHFERPEDPEGEEYLNCFLAVDPCPDCGHPAPAEPILVPEPHAKLLTPVGDEP